MCEAHGVADGSPLHLYPGLEDLRDPVLVLAYAGWSDGGDAATSAVRYLLGELSVSRYGYVDTEEFLDFTVVRPHARRRSDGRRDIVWPNHEFFAARLADEPCDLVLGLGVEPHLRWKAYSTAMVELVQSGNFRMVVMLGAYLDDVIYSQPVDVNGFSSDAALVEQHGLSESRYEGPTGITGVLGDAFRREGIPSLSLWARVPHYVPQKPNARGACALLRDFENVTGLHFDLSSLETEAASYDETVSELVANDPQLSAYVRELKRRAFTQ
ncbi:MAG: PAC2 family protein [Deltaproteobacteria bacterium]|nr:PAC2 family protein [Deltaproteobacteria bacterium]MBW2414195.1 PAC2 family protein [Deltaproteobacteria bacterium]